MCILNRAAELTRRGHHEAPASTTQEGPSVVVVPSRPPALRSPPQEAHRAGKARDESLKLPEGGLAVAGGALMGAHFQ